MERHYQHINMPETAISNVQWTTQTVSTPSELHIITLQWRHNGHDSVTNHQRLYCLLKRFYGRRSKKTSKPRPTGLCEGNSPATGEFPAQMASNAENVSIWWCHHEHLTHWGQDKKGTIFPVTFLNGFFFNENVSISIKISLKFYHRGPIKNIPALV